MTAKSRAASAGVRINPEDVLRIADKHEGKRSALIAMLEDLQAVYNYLPRQALQLLARHTGISLVDIFGVANFYKHFSLEPRGEHTACVCLGTACHVRGAPAVLDAFESELGLKAGETSADREFSLSTVACLGACALGPVAVVDGEYQREVGAGAVRQIVHRCREEVETRSFTQDERYFRVDVSCPRCNRSLMLPQHPIDGEPSIHVTTALGRKHGWLRLSSLYGSTSLESEHELPEDTVPLFFCPRCHAELRGGKLCANCSAPVIPLLVQGGGMIQFCSRQGCKEHLLDLSG